MQRGQSQVLFGDEEPKGSNWNIGGSFWTLGKASYCDSDWSQVVQGGCGVSILAYVQKSPGHAPG